MDSSFHWNDGGKKWNDGNNWNDKNFMKKFYIYILANKYHGTLYIGLTSNLVKRIWEHKNNLAEGFTKKYQIHKLIYFEEYLDSQTALAREKNLKAWKRDWKIELIERQNKNWIDLYKDLI